jgi:hypothetical protein
MVWTDVPCWYAIRTDASERLPTRRDATMPTAPSFLQPGPMFQTIGSIWNMSSLAPYGGQSVRR